MVAPNLLGNTPAGQRTITVDPVVESNKPLPLDKHIVPSITDDSGANGGMRVIPKNQRVLSPEDLKSAPSQSDGATFYQHGNAPIVAMQQSLINLSRDIASHNIHDVADRTTDKGEFVNGSNPFMNFLITNYANRAHVSGKQLANTDLKQPARMDTAKENDNFKGVLQTINRIGSPGAEQRPDGIWGPRTNNALKEIYGLAHALIEVKKDMGLEISGYSETDLAELYTMIPDNISLVKNINQKINMAIHITTNLNKLRALYDNFRETILNNPTYRAHIAQEQPLLVDKEGHSDKQKFDVDSNLYEAHKNTNVEVDMGEDQVLNLVPYDLATLDNFKKFLLRNNAANLKVFNLSPEDEEAVKKNDPNVLNSIISRVVNGLTSHQNMQTSR